MKIEVVTLFPRMITAALEFGIVGRAVQRGLLSVGTEDPRAHTTDVHRTVDDRPYGGGPGMVMKPEPLLAAIRAAHARLPPGSPRVYLSAQGRPFRQAQAQELATRPGVLRLAGARACWATRDSVWGLRFFLRADVVRHDRDLSAGRLVGTTFHVEHAVWGSRWCCPPGGGFAWTRFGGLTGAVRSTRLERTQRA